MRCKQRVCVGDVLVQARSDLPMSHGMFCKGQQGLRAPSTRPGHGVHQAAHAARQAEKIKHQLSVVNANRPHDSEGLTHPGRAPHATNVCLRAAKLAAATAEGALSWAFCFTLIQSENVSCIPEDSASSFVAQWGKFIPFGNISG